MSILLPWLRIIYFDKLIENSFDSFSTHQFSTDGNIDHNKVASSFNVTGNFNLLSGKINKSDSSTKT